MIDFETLLLALATVGVIIVACGLSWLIISAVWWVICQMVGWQFSFAVSTAIWIGLTVLKQVFSRD